MDQKIISEVCNIATSYAMNGHPLRNIVYVPPLSATQSKGTFILEYAPSYSATEKPCWEK